MNILFINEFQVIENHGGVQRVTKLLSNFFLSRGFDIYFIYCKPNTNKIIKSKNEFRFQSPKICTWYNKNLLQEIINNKNIDIIINQMGFSQEIIKLFKALNSDIPFLSCLHSSPFFELKEAEMRLSNNISLKNPIILNIKIILKPLYLFFLKKKIAKKLSIIYHNSTYTILLSCKFYHSFQKMLNDTKKLKAIANPLNPEFKYYNDILSTKQKTILYVGRLNKGKRVDLLLYIWQQIQELFPDWNFDIVGDGPEYLKLRALSYSLNLENITFYGSSLDVEKFYLKASIFISASAFEGFPMTLTEAQFFGSVPVVYNTYESVTDVIINEETGFIIPDLNSKEFIIKLTQIIQNDLLRNKMANKGIEYVKKFNLEIIGKKWLDIFEQFNLN